MDTSKLTPSTTARILSKELNELVQYYAHKLCLFWDESTHCSGCMGGDDSGIVALICEIKTKASGGHVIVKIKTCCDVYEIDVDNLCIAEEKRLYLADEDSVHFECDEYGYFEDVAIEPIFDYYELDSIENLWLHDSIGKIVAEYINDHFLDEECIVTDMDCDEEENESEVIESVDYEDDEDYNTMILINDAPINYHSLKIQAIE